MPAEMPYVATSRAAIQFSLRPRLQGSRYFCYAVEEQSGNQHDRVLIPPTT